MRFANIAVVLTFAASVLAWRIPEGTEDGVYKVETLEDGSTVHTKVIDAADIDRTSPEYAALNNLVPTEPSLDTSLEKRGKNGGVWCGCGYNLIHGDCDAAVADLKSQMKYSLVAPGNAYYSIRGRVVAFACNAGNYYSTVLYAQLMTDAAAKVTSSCGWYVAGATQLGNDDQALLMGYQQWNGGDDFCGCARCSTQTSC